MYGHPDLTKKSTMNQKKGVKKSGGNISSIMNDQSNDSFQTLNDSMKQTNISSQNNSMQQYDANQKNKPKPSAAKIEQEMD